MGNRVVHFEITGKDHARLKSFYGELFDWKIGPDMGPQMGHYALVDAESAGIGGGIGNSMDGPVQLTFYVEVPDLQATLDAAVAKGGKVLMPPMEIPGVVTMAMFADPEGNAVGLVKG